MYIQNFVFHKKEKEENNSMMLSGYIVGLEDVNILPPCVKMRRKITSC